MPVRIKKNYLCFYVVCMFFVRCLIFNTIRVTIFAQPFLLFVHHVVWFYLYFIYFLFCDLAIFYFNLFFSCKDKQSAQNVFNFFFSVLYIRKIQFYLVYNNLSIFKYVLWKYSDSLSIHLFFFYFDHFFDLLFACMFGPE